MMRRFWIVVLLAGLMVACAEQAQPVETPTGVASAADTATMDSPTPNALPASEEPPTALPTVDTPTVERAETVTSTSSPPTPSTEAATSTPSPPTIEEFAVPAGSRPHDVAPAPDGSVWYTAQRRGELGWLDLQTGETQHIPLGSGSAPHGVIVGPDGAPWVTDGGLNAIARIDRETNEALPIEPPTPGQGARRVWSDSQGRLWVSEWNAGQLAMYDPVQDAWREWRLPGDRPRPYAVYVDEQDVVWLSDFGANALVRFDPQTETFTAFALPSAGAEVRQILGRPGQVWGAESGTDKLVVIRTGSE